MDTSSSLLVSFYTYKPRLIQNKQFISCETSLDLRGFSFAISFKTQPGGLIRCLDDYFCSKQFCCSMACFNDLGDLKCAFRPGWISATCQVFSG